MVCCIGWLLQASFGVTFVSTVCGKWIVFSCTEYLTVTYLSTHTLQWARCLSFRWFPEYCSPSTDKFLCPRPRPLLLWTACCTWIFQLAPVEHWADSRKLDALLGWKCKTSHNIIRIQLQVPASLVSTAFIGNRVLYLCVKARSSGTLSWFQLTWCYSGLQIKASHILIWI